MTVSLIRKLMISVVSLTTYFLIYIGAINYDLRRPISKSIFTLIPPLFFLGIGIAIRNIIIDPDFFKTIVVIKSGFARKIIGSTLVPLIANAIYTMSIIGGQVGILDKLLYFLRSYRLPYIFYLLTIIGLLTIASTTMIAMIMESQQLIGKTANQLADIAYYSGIALGAINAFVLFAIIVKFARSKSK